MSNNGSSNELFPSMASESNPSVHLFAEPTLVINGHFYAAASPKQFCLYPDEYQDILLLREVFIDEPGHLGPLFWASDEIPVDYAEASALNNVIGFKSMDNDTQAILTPFLTNPGEVPPCDLNSEYTTKCEWCQGGCQITDYPTPLENERCHYIVPPSPTNGEEQDEEDQVDIILYRTRVAGEVNHLYAGSREGIDSNWSDIVETNIADDVSNINAGNLVDGRAYLISNAMVNVVRLTPSPPLLSHSLSDLSYALFALLL